MNEGTSRTGPVSNFVRWMFGAPTVSSQGEQQGTGSSGHEHATTPATTALVQGSHVPIDVAVSNQGIPLLYGDFFDRYNIYIARQQDQVLVTAGAFDRQDPESGEIYWQSEHADEESTRERVGKVVKIYEHLAAAGAWHNSIVRFTSRHGAGYMLERLNPGPIQCDYPDAKTSDTHLALYQRWALQLISALSHLHSNGIVLNALADEGLWLRPDYSIAVANFVNAGCEEVKVSAGYMMSHHLTSPWSPIQLYDTIEEGKIYPGVPKGDIFDWATVVYAWMSGKADPEHYEDWSKLEEERFGDILVRAWKGQYASAADVLKEVKDTLEANGRDLAGDDISGIDWSHELEILAKEDGGSELRLKSAGN